MPPKEECKIGDLNPFTVILFVQLGGKCKDCKRNKEQEALLSQKVRAFPSSEDMYIQIMEGRDFGPDGWHAARYRIELAVISPFRQDPWRWRLLAGKQAGGGAWAVPRRQVEQHHHDSLFRTVLLLHSSAHTGADMQVLETPPEKCTLRDFRWSTAGSTCKRGDQHAEQIKVLSCCGTRFSPGSLLLFSSYDSGFALSSCYSALICRIPRDQVISLTVITVNKLFCVWLPGKSWTCIALLDKKCCKQTTENSI